MADNLSRKPVASVAEKGRRCHSIRLPDLARHGKSPIWLCRMHRRPRLTERAPGIRKSAACGGFSIPNGPSILRHNPHLSTVFPWILPAPPYWSLWAETAVIPWSLPAQS